MSCVDDDGLDILDGRAGATPRPAVGRSLVGILGMTTAALSLALLGLIAVGFVLLHVLGPLVAGFLWGGG